MVVIAEADALEVIVWRTHHLPWGDAARASNEAREAGVVAFVRDQGLEAIVTGSVTSTLRGALQGAGIPVFERAALSARAAAASAAAVLDVGLSARDAESEARLEEGR